MSQQIKNPKLLIAIGLRLKSIRKDKKLSQEEVYNDTDIHIARIETGTQNVTVSTLSALCDYYMVTLEEFFSKIPI